MSDSGYTPTEAEVKSAWVGSKPNIGMLVVRDRHAAEFERFVAVIRKDQAERDIAIVNQLYPLGSEVLGNAPTVIAVALRSQSFTGTEEVK